MRSLLRTAVIAAAGVLMYVWPEPEKPERPGGRS